MHSCELACEWDLAPVQITVRSLQKPVAYAVSALHNEHSFFIFKDVEQRVVAYVDALAPQRAEQRARIRDARGTTLAVVRLVTPAPATEIGSGALFAAELRDKDDALVCAIEEQRAAATSFWARLRLPDDGDEVGEVRDELSGGKIRTRVELDLHLRRPVAWGLGAVLADLARLRRRGWPKAKGPEAPGVIEPIEQALGPRKRR